MKHLINALILALVVAAVPESLSAQGRNAGTNTNLGTVTLGKKVMADGKPLAAGTYQVRLTSDEPQPGVGQSPSSERYVEFVRGGKVMGRELATVVPNSEIGSIAKGARPASGSAKVEMLKGNDYIRVWINRGGNNYIINMPPAA